MKRILLFAALIAWSAMASAVVYRWTDASGKVQYGDRPPDGVKAEVVQITGNRPADAPPRQAAAPPASASTNVNAPAAPAKGADSTLKQQVDQDVAQTKDKQCADAQDRYKKLIEGRHLYKAGENGERQYLSSEEIDQERINAKRDIDAICNSQT
jgi:hypothetical protein